MLLEKIKASMQNLFLFSCLMTALYNTINTALLPININPFLYLTLLLGFMDLLIKIQKRELRFNKYSSIILIYLFFVILSIFLNIDTYNDQSFINILIINFAMIFGLFCINGKKDNYNKSFFIICFFSTFMNLCAFILMFLNIEIAFYGNKLNGIYSNPNLGGQVTLISILILLFFIKDNKNYNNRVILYICLFINVLFLFFNGNKNSFFIFFVLMLFTLLKRVKRIYFVFLVMISCFVIIILLILKNGYISWSLDLNDYTNFEVIVNQLSTERYAIWKESIYLIKNSFWFGYGIDNLQMVAFNNIGDISRIVARGITATHNIILQLFIDGGFFAFITFFIFVFIVLKDMGKSMWKHNLFTYHVFPYTLILCSLLFSFLDIGIINYIEITSYIFWTQLTIILNNKCINKETSECLNLSVSPQ